MVIRPTSISKWLGKRTKTGRKRIRNHVQSGSHYHKTSPDSMIRTALVSSQAVYFRTMTRWMLFIFTWLLTKLVCFILWEGGNWFKRPEISTKSWQIQQADYFHVMALFCSLHRATFSVKKQWGDALRASYSTGQMIQCSQ